LVVVRQSLVENHQQPASNEKAMELIRLENISKTYQLGEVNVPALRGISLSIGQGEMVALMGASGSGKTTLMNILGCLDHPTGGEYWLDGREMSGLTPNERAVVRSEKLGFVFQNFNLLARTTALFNVLMPLDYALQRPAAKESQEWARSLLQRVGLADRVDHEPSQMSGGQQQRVAIGRSLVNRPALLLADEPTGNLDSHTSVEILRMFQRLNAEGITVILVTHDPSVAAFARRTIRIHDGRVESDTLTASSVGEPALDGSILHQAISRPHVPVSHPEDGNGNGSKVLTAEETAATAVRISLPISRRTAPAAMAELQTVFSAKGSAKSRSRSAPWRVSRTILTALGALRRNKMRSALTTLGIIIGVAAVIAVVEFSQGSTKFIQTQMSSMGVNSLMIQPGASTSAGVNFGMGSVMTLTPEDAEAIAQQCPAVGCVAPMVRARTQIVYKNRNWSPMFIYGTTPSYLAVRDWKLVEGGMFTDRDVRSGNQVCVLGDTLVRELFQNQSPLGKTVRMNNVPFRVLGVLSHKGANMVGMDMDDVVLAPWLAIKNRVVGSSVGNVNQSAAAAGSTSATSASVNTLNNKYPGTVTLYPAISTTQTADRPQLIRFTNVDTIMASAASTKAIPQAIQQITRLLHERHHIRQGDDEDFNIRDMTEMSKVFSQTSQMMGLLLLIVAMISLVVGGVGIMNIMLVSVTERTREIGLRMAVGARSHHILRQFLVEAVVLCLFGGALGILFGRSLSILLRTVVHCPTQTSIPAIVASVAVSATVGVIFGFYPAWKASRLDPIEALRYE
jgi:macrolide transport system ATP-binding/permease protein